MDDRAMSGLTQERADRLMTKLQQVNRNILDEANRIGEDARSVLGSSYDSLLGEAAGVRMAIGFLRQALEEVDG